MQDDEHQMFLRNCGHILIMGLGIETHLDFFISNYFCSPQNYKTFRFQDLMLINLNFGRKIEIFKEICISENINKERIGKVLKAIKEVQKIRNRVAHDQAFVSDPKEGTKLRKRKSVTYKKDELKITDELITNRDKNRLFSIQEISQIHLELYNSSKQLNGDEW